MARHQWAALNNQQVGAYAEYFVKMELAMHGFEVYSPEVDDHGIDLIARKKHGQFIEVQVKSLRDHGYVFMRKYGFELRDDVYLALVLLFDNEPPRHYLIPASKWQNPTGVFVDRNYGEGLKSKPEWGIKVSRKHMPIIDAFAFDRVIESLKTE